MKIAVFAASAALLGLVAVTPASAVSPSAIASATAKSDGITLIAQKKWYGKKRPFKYRAGGRYRNAPHGWHSYHGRPLNWATRGCVVVGPIWWCP